MTGRYLLVRGSMKKSNYRTDNKIKGNVNKIKKTNTVVSVISALFILGSAVLSLAQPVYAQGSDYYDDDEYHADLDYSDMEIQWIDEDATDAYIEEARKLIETGTDEDIIKMYDKIDTLVDYMSTMHVLNEIRYNCNINNEEYAELSRHMSEYTTDLGDRILILLRDVLNSPHADALKAHINDDEIVESLLEYEDMTDEEKALAKERDELVQDYEKLLMGDVSTEIDGETWSFERLNNDEDLSYEEYYEMAGILYKELNSQLATIYIDLVKNLNRQAELMDYDNYAVYAYEETFGRDYDAEDAEGLYENVRKYIVPLDKKIQEDTKYNFKLETLNLSGEERIARVAPVISKIHPDLQEAWDYLTDHGLYDIDSSPTKLQGGYTMALYSYGSAFIYDYPYENWRDIETVIHEFGHYNETFHSKDSVITSVHNVDVAEIHSQGLELLCLEYADEIYGDGLKEAVTYNVLGSMTNSIIDGCIYDAFQHKVYTYEGELTVEELNRMFYETANSFGAEYEPDSLDVYGWVTVTHTFEQPMYYIGYATSALAALDILAMSVENREAAIDCYMHLTTYHGQLGFRETLDDVGLPDIFDDGVVEDISIAVEEYINGKSKISALSVLKDPVLIVSVIIIIAVVIAIICIRAKARKEMKNRQLQQDQQNQQMY